MNAALSQVVTNSDREVRQSPAEKRAAYLMGLLVIARDRRNERQFVQTDDEATPIAAQAFEGIAKLQTQAAARIPELAIPSTRDEAWRFTDLSKLLSANFVAAGAVQGQDEPQFVLTGDWIAPYVLPDTHRLVFVDGVFSAEWSDLAGIGETLVLGNASVLTDTTHLAKLPDADEVFTTLNTASFRDLAVIQAQRNATVEQPIHLLFVSTAGATLANPRTLVVAEAGSSLTLIEDYVSLGQGQAFTNAVTELVLKDNAEVRHSLIQRDNDAAFFLNKTAVLQARDSRYTNIAVQLGGALSRHNLEVHHDGTQVESNLYGLAIASNHRLVDTHSNIQYREPHCQSDQLYKAIATDNARSVFSGRVDVPQAAQQTNATQLNRNLLLSNRARIDTKPQLEIVADDVKCTHGATVSQLEDDEIFYLQSRGIDRENAQRLLIEAFTTEILQKLPVGALRQSLIQHVMQLTALNP